ncbi:MAG: hypothetical protein JXB09_03160 [Deltaproteobacteria bacterium]|nr:hypothetical protein [Deltaproteobacteria bacterium]
MIIKALFLKKRSGAFVFYEQINLEMNQKGKPKDLIARYFSAIIEGLVKKISASSPLNHKLTKGELRELFVSNVLSTLLTSQYGIGTGIIINQNKDQSNQTDIIIYDNRILPPFIKEQHIGIYPAESVVGVIEVKSHLRREEILSSEKSAEKLQKVIYNPASSLYGDYHYLRPLCATIGFYGSGGKELKDSETGKLWLMENIQYNFALCLVGKFSWMNLQNSGWAKSNVTKNFEETKRFIAVYVDNLRTLSERRMQYIYGNKERAHKDWFSIYIRNQN